MSLRICHMIPGFFPIAKGGAEMFTLNLCKKLQRRGHVIHILTRNLNLPKEESYKGIQIHRFRNLLPYSIKILGFGQYLKSKYLRMLVAFFDVLGGVLSLWKLQKRNRFHVIHASFIVPLGLVGLLIKKFFKTPLVITVHGPADFYEVPQVIYPVLRFILKRCNVAVAVSPRLEYDLTKKLGALPLKVICNGIPFPAKSPAQNRNNLGPGRIAAGDFVILTAGRLVRRKRVDLLVRALPKLLEKIPEAKLLVLGGGIERAKLAKLIDELQLEPFVVMPGWVSEEEKNAFFARADVFMQLSEREGLSLALLESKAAGVPAIIVGSSGSWEPINPGTTGLLLEPPITVDKIVEQTVFLNQNPELRRQMGETAQMEAQRTYTLQKMVDDYISIYNEVREKNRGYL